MAPRLECFCYPGCLIQNVEKYAQPLIVDEKETNSRFVEDRGPESMTPGVIWAGDIEDTRSGTSRTM
jgi:hypothetical protein